MALFQFVLRALLIGPAIFSRPAVKNLGLDRLLGFLFLARGFHSLPDLSQKRLALTISVPFLFFWLFMSCFFLSFYLFVFFFLSFFSLREQLFLLGPRRRPRPVAYPCTQRQSRSEMWPTPRADTRLRLLCTWPPPCSLTSETTVLRVEQGHFQ